MDTPPSYPLVTIGIPVFNSQQFLHQAIASVLNQSYPHFELIITDDGSTDSSLNIAQSFADPRIIVLADSQNKGISFRLNQQVQIARGTYFARMDADDLMLPNRIASQLSFMQQHPEFDVVGSAVCVIDDHNNLLGYRKPSHTHTLAKAIQGAAFVHPSVMGKTDWFKKHPYRQDLTGMEDYELWIRTVQNSHFGYIDDILLFYRDPLQFKLKTYLFRQQQLRKFFRTDAKKYIYLPQRAKYIGASYLKSVLSWALSSLKLDSLMIQKRNTPFANTNQKEILKEILLKQ